MRYKSFYYPLHNTLLTAIVLLIIKYIYTHITEAVAWHFKVLACCCNDEVASLFSLYIISSNSHKIVEKSGKNEIYSRVSRMYIHTICMVVGWIMTIRSQH